MDEYQINQLMVAMRAEFDGATALYVLFSLAIMALVSFVSEQRESRWNANISSWLYGFYAVIAAFIVIRGAAAIVRFAELSALLASMDPTYHPGFLPLQLPTVILRLVLLIVTTTVTIKFMRATLPR